MGVLLALRVLILRTLGIRERSGLQGLLLGSQLSLDNFMLLTSMLVFTHHSLPDEIMPSLILVNLILFRFIVVRPLVLDSACCQLAFMVGKTV